MHWIVLALVVAVGWSGCLADDDNDSSVSPANDANGQPCPEAERDGVVVWTGTYQAAPGAPFEVDVSIPECAAFARYELSSLGVGNPNGATVTLTGCGSDEALGQPTSVQIGNGNDVGNLCDAPSAGTQTIRVAPMAPMTGTLTVRMDMVPE